MNSKKYKYCERIATMMGLGYLGKMPGTNGSIVALPTGYFIMQYVGFWYFLAIIIGVFMVAVWAIDVVERVKSSHDDGAIIIDEWVGQSLLLCFTPMDLKYYVVALVLFRVLDIVKPFPINWFDKNIHGGIGVMVDDVVAAVVAIPFVIFLGLY